MSSVENDGALVPEHASADENLATLARVCGVGLACIAAWFWHRTMRIWSPPPSVEATTVAWFTGVAALIALLSRIGGPALRGRRRHVRDGVALAFSVGWVLIAIDTVVKAAAG